MSQNGQSKEKTDDGSDQEEGTSATKEEGRTPRRRHHVKEDDDDTDEEDEDDSSDEDSSEEDGEKGKKEESKDREKKKKPMSPRKKRMLIGIAIVFGLVLIVGGIIIWLIVRQYVSTDDAYIDGHISQIAPRVAAQVVALHFDDNQLMRRGDLLVELDPTDFEVALDQAKAQVLGAQGKLAQAQAQIGSAKASVVQAQAEIDAATVAHDNAARDLKRFQEVDARARSQQQLDNATAAEKNAQAQLDQAKARKVSADASVTTSEAAVKAAEGDLRTSEANQRKAEVNLSYCKINAPVDGRVTERTVDVGDYVSPGQALFSLVDPNVWVTANFKETQLTHMQPGQPVTIKVDAYPGHKFQGKISSIQAGSGSRFSVLPAENATGNYVKIVQRVPVKIYFEHDANTNDAMLLSPGLSVIPRVKVR